ncbi:MAG: hypothetical protein WBO73_04460 [Gammaproteobacteria bacterium]|jgi:hypothetical protein
MEPEILSGTVGIVIIFLLIFLFILWFLLPFAVFGIKGRLDKLIDQNEQIVTLLQNSANTFDTNPIENAKEKIEPTIQLTPQVYSTATGEMKPE